MGISNQYRWFSYWNAHWCWISPSLTPSGSGQEAFRLRHNQQLPAWEPKTAQRLGLWIPKNILFFFGKINVWDHMRSYLVGGAITILKNISQWLSHIWYGKKCLTPPTGYDFMEKGLRISRTWDWKCFQQRPMKFWCLPSNGTLTHPQNNDGNRFRITMSHHKESCLLFAIFRIRGQWLWRSRYNTNKMNEQYSKTWNIELHYIITVITYNLYININSANVSITIWRFPKVGVPPVLIHLKDGCATK